MQEVGAQLLGVADRPPVHLEEVAGPTSWPTAAGSPLTDTRPSATSPSAARRLATPARARARWTRIRSLAIAARAGPRVVREVPRLDQLPPHPLGLGPAELEALERRDVARPAQVEPLWNRRVVRYRIAPPSDGRPASSSSPRSTSEATVESAATPRRRLIWGRLIGSRYATTASVSSPRG